VLSIFQRVQSDRNCTISLRYAEPTTTTIATQHRQNIAIDKTKQNKIKQNRAMPPKKPPVGKQREERPAPGKKTTRRSTKGRDCTTNSSSKNKTLDLRLPPKRRAGVSMMVVRY